MESSWRGSQEASESGKQPEGQASSLRARQAAVQVYKQPENRETRQAAGKAAAWEAGEQLEKPASSLIA